MSADPIGPLLARQPKGSTLLREFWLVADKLILNQNQQGVNSRYYRPGPYGPMEPSARAFAEWYLQTIGERG